MRGHPFSLLVSVQCSAGGCLIELAQQLAVIMIGKQIINNAQEILVPKMKAWWQKRQVNIGHTQTEESQEYLFIYDLLNNAVSSSLYYLYLYYIYLYYSSLYYRSTPAAHIPQPIPQIKQGG
jgi:hypothetical protein